MSASLSKSLRIIALKSVLDPDVDYFHRHVFRWYSKQFHTPLHIVDSLPLEDVLMAYYESRYEDLAGDEDRTRLIEELQELTETDAERWKREMGTVEADKVSDDEFIKKLIEEEKAKKKKPDVADLKVAEKPSLNLNAKDPEPPRKLEPFPEMPDIKMSFDDEKLEEMDQFGAWGLFDEPKKP